MWKRILAIALFAATSQLADAQPTVLAYQSEVVIAQGVKKGTNKAIRPDRRAIAIVANLGTWLKPVQQLLLNETKVYEAEQITNLVFSSDSRHLAFAAKHADLAVVVVDAIELGRFKDIGANTLVFSSTNAHLAFAAQRQSGNWVLGLHQLGARTTHYTEEYDEVGSTIILNPITGRPTYSARTGQDWRVVHDGKPQRVFDLIGGGSLVASPDVSRYAYAGRVVGQGWVVVNDGQESGPYPDLVSGSFTFSPDSKSFAYAVAERDAQFVVLNGLRQKKYKKIGARSLSFSPDSASLGYLASNGNGWFAVIGGREGPSFSALFSPPLFSTDGTQYAYVAGESAVLPGEMYVVLGDKRLAPHDAVLPQSLAFSPRGDKLAYVARRGSAIGGKFFLVVGGRQGAEYDDILLKDFNFFGPRSLLQFHQYYQSGKPISPWRSENLLEYLAIRDEEVLLVTMQTN